MSSATDAETAVSGIRSRQLRDNERPEDERLAERCRRGDPAALETMIALHRPQVVRLARGLLGGDEDLDDVVQDVFVAAVEGLGRFRGECGLRTWLARITVNRCRWRLRRRSLWRRAMPWLARAAPATDVSLTALETSERNGQVRRAVAHLPARYREPTVLRYFEQLSVREIAQLLQISPGAVEVRLSRARAKLRELLTTLAASNETTQGDD